MAAIGAQPPSSAVTCDEIVALLAPAVGDRPAREAVATACAALGLDPSDWPLVDALNILDYLTHSPGLLGISARFAKTRAILLWSQR